jgi:hypothetical protein
LNGPFKVRGSDSDEDEEQRPLPPRSQTIPRFRHSSDGSDPDPPDLRVEPVKLDSSVGADNKRLESEIAQLKLELNQEKRCLGSLAAEEVTLPRLQLRNRLLASQIRDIADATREEEERIQQFLNGTSYKARSPVAQSACGLRAQLEELQRITTEMNSELATIEVQDVDVRSGKEARISDVSEMARPRFLQLEKGRLRFRKEMEKASSALRDLDEAEGRMKRKMAQLQAMCAQSGASPHLMAIRIAAENARLQSELQMIEHQAQLISKSFGGAPSGRDVSKALASLRKTVHGAK